MRDWKEYQRDILKSALKIQSWTAGLDRSAFFADERTYDATLRNLEIIGEAQKHLSEDFISKTRSVPWRQISNMRNIIAHAYFGMDEDILWNVVRVEIPLLIAAIVDSETDTAGE